MNRYAWYYSNFNYSSVFIIDTDLRAIEVKIMSLLDGHASEYDLDRAMLLMHSFQFELGAKYLMERNLSTDLLVRMGIETQRYVYKQVR